MNSIVDAIKRVFGLGPARRQEPTPAQQPVAAPRPAEEITPPPMQQADEAAQVPVAEAAMATAPPEEVAAESGPAAEARPDASQTLVEEVSAVAAPDARAGAAESPPDVVATLVEAELPAAAEAPMEPTPLVVEALGEPAQMAEPAEPAEAIVEVVAVEAAPLAWESAAEAEAAPAGVDASGESMSAALPFEMPAEPSAEVLVAEQEASEAPPELWQPTADTEGVIPTADAAAADAEAGDTDEQVETAVPPEVSGPAAKPAWPEEPLAQQ